MVDEAASVDVERCTSSAAVRRSRKAERREAHCGSALRRGSRSSRAPRPVSSTCCGGAGRRGAPWSRGRPRPRCRQRRLHRQSSRAAALGAVKPLAVTPPPSPCPSPPPSPSDAEDIFSSQEPEAATAAIRRFLTSAEMGRGASTLAGMIGYDKT